MTSLASLASAIRETFFRIEDPGSEATKQQKSDWLQLGHQFLQSCSQERAAEDQAAAASQPKKLQRASSFAWGKSVDWHLKGLEGTGLVFSYPQALVELRALVVYQTWSSFMSSSPEDDRGSAKLQV